MNTSPIVPSHLASRRRNLLGSLALAVVALSAAQAHAQVRTVLVSPVPGNFLASGTALRNAIAAIPAPTSSDRWLVKIEPGIYDVGSVPLPMRPWVDIEGSGIGVTTIRGSADGSFLNAATIHGASNSELRLLTVEATHSVAAIAMYNPAASPRLYRVRFTSQSKVAWGLRNAAAAPLIEECEFRVTGTGGSGSITYGIVFSATAGLPAGRSSLLRSKIAVSGAQTNHGIWMEAGLILTEIRDSRIDAVGGNTSYGLYANRDPFWSGTEQLSIRDTEISSAGGSNASYGLRSDFGATFSLSVHNSMIWGHVAPQSYGIVHNGGPTAGIQGSSLLGFTEVASIVGNMSISSTSLNGGPTTATGWLGCMGVWDEAAVFYPNACPP